FPRCPDLGLGHLGHRAAQSQPGGQIRGRQV
ncbi:MAG: hypothetical protein AVDCRST_MAG75-2256, partial [uncultured Propionibacteriaceae bacterium]